MEGSNHYRNPKNQNYSNHLDRSSHNNKPTTHLTNRGGFSTNPSFVFSAPFAVSFSTPRPQAGVEQSEPVHPGLQIQVPPEQLPLPEQLLGHSWVEQSTPEYPESQTQLPLTHWPLPQQSLGQLGSELFSPDGVEQSWPVQPGSQMQNPSAQ